MLPSIVSYETEREPCVPAEYGHVGDVTWAGWGPDRGRYTYLAAERRTLRHGLLLTQA